MKKLAKLSCIPLVLMMTSGVYAAKSSDGEKIDLSTIEARLTEIEAAVATQGTEIASIQTAIGALQTDVGALQSAVGALQSEVQAIQFQNLSADCDADSNALQAAVNEVSISGGLIMVSGNCGPVVVGGKTNLEIDGQGITSVVGNASDGLDAAFFVANSQNIQINGILVNAGSDDLGLVAFASTISVSNSDITSAGSSALGITDTTNAKLDNVTVNGTLYAEKGSSFRTESVIANSPETAILLTNGASFQGAGLNVPSPGQIQVVNGASMQIDDGVTGGRLDVSEGSSLELSPEDGQLISIDGGLNLFRNSTMVARGAGVNIPSNLVVYYGSSAAIGVDASVTGALLVQYNSVFTLFSGTGNFAPRFSRVRFGSGFRNFLGNPAFAIDQCDGTQWLDGDVSCP